MENHNSKAMSKTERVDVLAVMDADARAVACVIDDCKSSRRCDEWVAHLKKHDAARAAVAELIEAQRPLVARSFDEARDNEDQRIAARKAGTYPPPEMLWCRADALNPCWLPGTPYTGKHWGWTPDMDDDGAVCEHCRLRAALARVQGGEA